MNKGEPEEEEWFCYTHGGKKRTSKRTLEWVEEVEALGAGELQVTSMDYDGMKQGFDHRLLRLIEQAVHIPVIASGGGGNAQHFADLFKQTIQDRVKEEKGASYTHYLLTEGTDKIAKKFGEEAVEVIIAAKNADKKDTANETADLLYHLGVLLYNQGVAVDDVATVLAERHQKNNNFKGERKDIDTW